MIMAWCRKSIAARAAAVVVVALIAAACVSLVLIEASTTQKASVGFVSAVKGKATLKRGARKEFALDGMNALRGGDVVKVAPRSAVTVNLCAAGRKFEVKGEAVFTVTGGRLKFSKGKQVGKGTIDKSLCATLAASAAKYDGRGEMSSEIDEAMGAMTALSILGSKSSEAAVDLKSVLDQKSGGGAGVYEKSADYSKSIEDDFAGLAYDSSDGSGSGTQYSVAYNDSEEMADDGLGKIYKPEAVYVQSTLTDVEVFSRPFLTWTQALDAVEYVVTIVNSVGATVFTARTARAWLEYPADAPALLPGGWYLCEVNAVYPESPEPVYADMFGLSVLSGEEAAQFLAEERRIRELAAGAGRGAEYRILLGKLYESRGLIAAAAAAYEEALATTPDNAELRSRLNNLKSSLQ